MGGPVVGILRLGNHDPSLPLPGYQTEGAAGLDLAACLPVAERDGGVTLAPGARWLAPTGLALEIPEGFEAQVRPRSGLALRDGLTLVNAPGTIDSDYRGEIGVILINHGAAPVTIRHGMRIAQIVFAPVARARLEEIDSASESRRGAGGFGSTGRGGGS